MSSTRFNLIRAVVLATVAAIVVVAGMVFHERSDDGDFTPNSGGARADDVGRPGIFQLALSRDGKRLFCRLSRGVEVRIVDTGSPVGWLDYRGRATRAMAISLPSDALVVAYHDGSLVRWERDPTSSGYRARLLARDPTILTCAVSGDARFIATGHSDGRVMLRDRQSGSLPRLMETHAGKARCVGFSRDGRCLLSAGSEIHICRVSNGESIAVLRGHHLVVQSATFSPTGDRVVSQGRHDGSIRLWDVAGNRQLCRFPTKFHYAIAVSPDGTNVGAADGNGDLCVRRLSGPQQKVYLPTRPSCVTCAVFSHDGTTIYAADVNGVVYRYEAASGRLTWVNHPSSRQIHEP